jgi:hypothetical protein
MATDKQAARAGRNVKAADAVVANGTKAAKAPRKVPAGTLSEKPKMAEPTNPPVEITEEQRKADRRADDITKNDAMARFVAQQTGETKPKVDIAAFEAEMAALKAKYGVTAEVKVKASKGDKIVQNGVTRPAASTLCGKIWAAADRISQRIHSVAPIALLREDPELKGVNDHTIKTQYAKWRAFNNVSGRLPRIQAVHQPAEGIYNEALPHIVQPQATEPAKSEEQPASDAPAAE